MSGNSHTAPITLPMQLKLLNALGPAAHSLKLMDLHEDADGYMAMAKRATGLSDFGTFKLKQALNKLLYTLKYEADLSLFGRIACRKMILRNLINNLLIEQECQQYPAVNQVDVEQPLIIVCTPRTGSTLLHNLLNQHDRVRSPKMWELHRPSPAPHPAQEFSDQRIRQSQWEFGLYYKLLPEMRAIHYFAPEAIEECTHLFAQTFCCRLSFSTLAGHNRYTEWLFQQDMSAAYRAYKRHLQLLTYHYPGRILILKSPGHILQLPYLEQVFPEARVVHLHRDPATAAGSFCSLTEAVQISLRNNVSPQSIGRMWQTYWTPAMLNSIDWRARTTLQVMDVDFKTLMKRPADGVQQIFEYFGWPVPDSLHANIRRYLSAHPKDEYGIHYYSLQRYGLNRDQLYRDYRRYIEHFKVSLEQPSLNIAA